MTAATESIPDDEVPGADGTSGKAKKKGGAGKFKAQDYHILHPRYSHYRSVVERVIHGIKHEIKFLAGPVYLEQEKYLSLLLVIACSLSNKKVKENHKFYFKND